MMHAATAAFDKGDYRWGAELLNQLVFAEPGHDDAQRAARSERRAAGYGRANAAAIAASASGAISR